MIRLLIACVFAAFGLAGVEQISKQNLDNGLVELAIFAVGALILHFTKKKSLCVGSR